MQDVNRAIERAEEETEDMEARAAALDELEDTGVLEDQLSSKSGLERELDEVSSDAEIEQELNTLQADVSGESATTSNTATETELETETTTTNGSAPDDIEVDDAAVEEELEELKSDEESA